MSLGICSASDNLELNIYTDICIIMNGLNEEEEKIACQSPFTNYLPPNNTQSQGQETCQTDHHLKKTVTFVRKTNLG